MQAAGHASTTPLLALAEVTGSVAPQLRVASRTHRRSQSSAIDATSETGESYENCASDALPASNCRLLTQSIASPQPWRSMDRSQGPPVRILLLLMRVFSYRPAGFEVTVDVERVCCFSVIGSERISRAVAGRGVILVDYALSITGADFVVDTLAGLETEILESWAVTLKEGEALRPLRLVDEPNLAFAPRILSFARECRGRHRQRTEHH